MRLLFEDILPFCDHPVGLSLFWVLWSSITGKLLFAKKFTLELLHSTIPHEIVVRQISDSPIFQISLQHLSSHVYQFSFPLQIQIFVTHLS